MDKKIYKNPFVLTLLAIIIITFVYSQTAASQTGSRANRSLNDISVLSLVVLVVYVIIQPYLRRKRAGPLKGISISLIIGFLTLVVIGFLVFGLAMSGG